MRHSRRRDQSTEPNANPFCYAGSLVRLLPMVLYTIASACGGPPPPAVEEVRQSALDLSAPGHGNTILWRLPSGELDAWRMKSGTSFNANVVGSVELAWQTVGSGDFNKDGVGDILWLNRRDNVASWWGLDNTPSPIAAPPVTAAPSFSTALTGDLDGDGVTDIIWTGTQQAPGAPVPVPIYFAVTWMMSSGSTTPRSFTTRTSSGDQVAALGNFDGDSLHRADILYRSPSTGAVTIALNGSATATLVGAPSTDWVIKGVGDFNNDKTTDVLWYNTTSGDVSIWLMQAGKFLQGTVPGTLAPSTGWQVLGVADANRDGVSDIVWQHSSGVVGIWTMANASTIKDPGALLTPPAGSVFAGIVELGSVAPAFDYSMPPEFGADYDGDGAIDLTPSASTLARLKGNSYNVTLDGCSSLDFGAPNVTSSPTSYAWTFRQGSQVVKTIATSGSCAVSTTLAQGAYSLTLTATTTDNRTATVTKNVTIKNYFIVSMGDSYASGQGNPNYPGNPAVWGTLADMNCHRSANSSHARAALAIERADNHSSVTFLSVACSGATVPNVINAAQNGNEGLGQVPPQIKQVQDLLCNNGNCSAMPNIDALLLSVGGNDINFSNTLHDCAAAVLTCSTDDDVTTPVYSGLVGLWPPDASKIPPTGPVPPRADNQGYDRLAVALSAGLPRISGVYLVQYPDPTHNDDGNRCDEIIFKDAAPLGADGVIGGQDVQWMSNIVFYDLDRAGRDASAANAVNGWHYLGDISQQFNHAGYCANQHFLIRYDESFAILGTKDGTMHPNASGLVATAWQIVVDLVNMGVVTNPFAPYVVPQEDPVLAALPFDTGDHPTHFPYVDFAVGQFKAECTSGWPMIGLSALGRPHSALCKTPFWGTRVTVPFTTLAQVQPPHGFGVQQPPEIFATTNSIDYGRRGQWDLNTYNKGECASGQFVVGIAQAPSGGGVDHIQCARSTDVSIGPSDDPAQCVALTFPGNKPASLPDGDWAFGWDKLECGNGQLMVGVSADKVTHLPHAIYCCNLKPR